MDKNDSPNDNKQEDISSLNKKCPRSVIEEVSEYE